MFMIQQWEINISKAKTTADKKNLKIFLTFIEKILRIFWENILWLRQKWENVN